MSDTTQVVDTTNQQYGYASDEVKVSPFNFGLNAGVTRLTKFEWIPNGGKDGAEGEALDIIFTINGTDKNYRLFPVTKAFAKDGSEITDPASTEMKDAFTDFNARITHILHCFQDIESIKAAFAKRIASFKDFCQVAMSILPTNYKDIPLDIFVQFQWQPSEGKERTYLDIPKKMSYGRWLAKAVSGATWKENRMTNPSESDREALYYSNDAGEKHPFVRNGWFMLSNFANQVKPASEGQSAIAGAAGGDIATAAPGATAAAW